MRVSGRGGGNEDGEVVDMMIMYREMASGDGGGGGGVQSGFCMRGVDFDDSC